jgi:hypothetical protein
MKEEDLKAEIPIALEASQDWTEIFWGEHRKMMGNVLSLANMAAGDIENVTVVSGFVNSFRMRLDTFWTIVPDLYVDPHKVKTFGFLTALWFDSVRWTFLYRVARLRSWRRRLQTPLAVLVSTQSDPWCGWTSVFGQSDCGNCPLSVHSVLPFAEPKTPLPSSNILLKCKFYCPPIRDIREGILRGSHDQYRSGVDFIMRHSHLTPLSRLLSKDHRLVFPHEHLSIGDNIIDDEKELNKENV